MIKSENLHSLVYLQLTFQNNENLVTFKYYNHEKGEVHTLFIDSNDLLHFSETNSVHLFFYKQSIFDPHPEIV